MKTRGEIAVLQHVLLLSAVDGEWSASRSVIHLTMKDFWYLWVFVDRVSLCITIT
jgi:hypothetical protein